MSIPLRPIDVFSAILVSVIWGANFVAAKHSLSFFPPFLLTGLRFVMVALLLIPFVARPTWAQFKQVALVATMGSLHFSLIFVALDLQLDIASSSLVGQLGVPFACLLGAIFLGDTMGWWRISGIIISFLGVIIITGAPNISEHLPGFYAALASTLTWGVASVMIKRIQGLHSMALLAWISLCNIPFLFLLSFLFERSVWPDLTQVPLDAVAGLVFTIVFSTLVAYGLWYHLLGRYNVSQVTPYTLLTPVFSIAFGQVFFQEQLTMPVILGGIVTIIGVTVIVIRRPQTIELGEAT